MDEENLTDSLCCWKCFEFRDSDGYCPTCRSFVKPEPEEMRPKPPKKKKNHPGAL